MSRVLLLRSCCELLKVRRNWTQQWGHTFSWSLINVLGWCCWFSSWRMARSDLSTYIGEMGVYQWRVFIALFIVFIFTADSVQIIFIAGHMPHWCRVPELEDLPYEIQKNVAIPAESVNRDGSVDEYSSCEMYSLNYSIYNHSEFYTWNRSLMSINNTPMVECSEWKYDQSQYISTIVSKVKRCEINSFS